jgi:hypothetical protein
MMDLLAVTADDPHILMAASMTASRAGATNGSSIRRSADFASRECRDFALRSILPDCQITQIGGSQPNESTRYYARDLRRQADKR